jgi:hypothetical protein
MNFFLKGDIHVATAPCEVLSASIFLCNAQNTKSGHLVPARVSSGFRANVQEWFADAEQPPKATQPQPKVDRFGAPAEVCSNIFTWRILDKI